MTRNLKLCLLFCFIPDVIKACPFCNRQVSDAIRASLADPGLHLILLPFVLLAIVVAALAALATHTSLHIKYRKLPLAAAAIVLGIGLGGFIDGIVFHQIFQLHEMLSNRVSADNYIGKSVNMFWDGIFHFFCLLTVIVGVGLLWHVLLRKNVCRSGRLLAGGLLMGWAAFNLLEGIIDHQVLQLHNVVERIAPHSFANGIFLCISLVLLVAGYQWVRHAKERADV